MTSKYSIKDLERLSGIKAHTLRIWELRYHILKPERTLTNIRFYDNLDLKRILNISLLNNNGHKISHIAKLSDKELIVEVEKFLNNYKKEDSQVESLVLCLIDMDENRFENTINNSINHFGFENTIEKIIFPFIKQMGNMWQVGIISPAQEHYISNLIRQKLIAGIDKLTINTSQKPKTYLFFLPNQESHEMGLLYTYYLTKAKGHKCLYLGQSVPLEDLINVANSTKANYLVTILTASLVDISLNAFVKLIHSKVENSELLLSGRLVLSGDEKIKKPLKKINIFKDYSEYKKLI